jgi:hypothetical protein
MERVKLMGSRWSAVMKDVHQRSRRRNDVKKNRQARQAALERVRGMGEDAILLDASFRLPGETPAQRERRNDQASSIGDPRAPLDGFELILT